MLVAASCKVVQPTSRAVVDSIVVTVIALSVVEIVSPFDVVVRGLFAIVGGVKTATVGVVTGTVVNNGAVENVCEDVLVSTKGLCVDSVVNVVDVITVVSSSVVSSIDILVATGIVIFKVIFVVPSESGVDSMADSVVNPSVVRIMPDVSVSSGITTVDIVTAFSVVILLNNISSMERVVV